MSLTDLPTEILANILSSLDLLSIYNLSLTRSTVYAQVQAHTTYRYLTSNQTTRRTLRILAQTTLLAKHSLTTLTNALHNSNCACCGKRAPYIYLLTATRACFVCLHHCVSLQLIPIELASTTLGTPTSALTQISLRTIPGVYDTESGVQHHLQPVLLVNVIQARDVAGKLFGAAALDSFMARRNVDVAFYAMPLESRGYFATPYTGLDFGICQVKIGLKSSFDGFVPVPKRGYRPKWKGMTGMGCEPWPVFNKDAGVYELDHDYIIPYRLANKFQQAKRDGFLTDFV